MRITQSRLKELLHYDPDTGVFTWKVKPAVRVRVRDIAGSLHAHGYLTFSVENVVYRAHRLAWLYMTGSWPEGEIDHQDGNRSNNRWSNLRDGSHSLNMQNLRGPKSSNTSGYLGVTYESSRGLFAAQIEVGGRKNRKCIKIGRFELAEDAHQAYVEAKRRLHPGCTI